LRNKFRSELYEIKNVKLIKKEAMNGCEIQSGMNSDL
jgi:hypothetical protein